MRTSAATRTRGARRCASAGATEGALVTIVDDGEGFDRDAHGDGQGLRNIRARIGSIGAALALRTSPGTGTALEVTLRT